MAGRDAAGRLTLSARLRSETQAAHEAVERALQLDRMTASRHAYRAVVERFYGFMLPWEERVGVALGDDAFFGPRRKLHLLARDLAHLGLDAAMIPDLSRCLDLPAIDGPAQALGSLYVIEGSTLGGQLILRQAKARLGLGPNEGCAYFASYGRDVGAMWKAFRERLSGVAPGDHAAAIGAANATFAALQAWLAPEELAERKIEAAAA